MGGVDSPLALLCAFANTAGPGRDDIATPGAMARWLRVVDPIEADDHRVVLALRDGLRDLIGGTREAFEPVNEALVWLGAAPKVVAADRVALAVPGSGGVRGAVGPIAAALVDAVGSGQLGRLRLCDGCATAFVGNGRGRGARWCDMATCGNRAKVAAYRARLRDSSGHPLEPARSVEEQLVRLAMRDR